MLDLQFLFITSLKLFSFLLFHHGSSSIVLFLLFPQIFVVPSDFCFTQSLSAITISAAFNKSSRSVNHFISMFLIALLTFSLLVLPLSHATLGGCLILHLHFKVTLLKFPIIQWFSGSSYSSSSLNPWNPYDSSKLEISRNSMVFCVII